MVLDDTLNQKLRFYIYLIIMSLGISKYGKRSVLTEKVIGKNKNSSACPYRGREIQRMKIFINKTMTININLNRYLYTIIVF